ncbi:MAG: hypothetical protein ACREGJ_04115 [Candidatus Saccharimonadales bacterium]
MNERSITIASILVIIVGLAVIVWVVIAMQQPEVGKEEVIYTDKISGEARSAFPEKEEEAETGHAHETAVNQVSISGLNDFYDTIELEQAESITEALTNFLRAQAGATSVTAGVLDASVSRIADSPATYKFTLVSIDPEARYDVTVKLSDDALTPEVTITEAQNE